VTDSLVEVFEGDGMTILLETYVGAVKGTSLYANEPGVSPWDYGRTRFSVKNGQTFWIDMNEIQGLVNVTGVGGTNPATFHPDNLIEVWGAGILAFEYAIANGEQFYVSSHVNHFGVTQWDGADLPSETILVVEEGSELSGTLSEEGFYLSESEVIGVPEWKTESIWWKKKIRMALILDYLKKKRLVFWENCLIKHFPTVSMVMNFCLLSSTMMELVMVWHIVLLLRSLQ